MYTIAFIGAGNMNGALITAACKKVPGERVFISDPSADKTAQLASDTGCNVAQSNREAVQLADYIVLGVKPQILPAVLSDIAPILQQSYQQGSPKVIVSIAAGQTIESIVSIIGCRDDYPVVRIMPNIPAMIGEGMLLISPSKGATDDQTRTVLDFFSASGRLEIIPESLQNAAAAVSGCGPAFVYMFIEAMADGAVKSGVPRALALEFAAAAVKGAASLVLESGKHPGVLKDEVCSPGGSTIVGVQALEDGGLRSIVMDAVCKSFERNAQLG